MGGKSWPNHFFFLFFFLSHLNTGVSLCVYVKWRRRLLNFGLYATWQPCTICDSHCINVLFFWLAGQYKVRDTKQKCRLRKDPVTTKKALFHMKRGLCFLYDKVCEDVSAHTDTHSRYMYRQEGFVFQARWQILSSDSDKEEEIEQGREICHTQQNMDPRSKKQLLCANSR